MRTLSPSTSFSTNALLNKLARPLNLFYLLFLCSTGIVLGQDYETTGLSDNWEDPTAWTCIGGGCNKNPYPNNNISNTTITIKHNINYYSNNPIKLGRNGNLLVINNAVLITASNINVDVEGLLSANQGQIIIGPGVLNNSGRIELINAILTKDGNVVNDSEMALSNACVNLTDGNFVNNNILTGSGGIKTLNGNINNFGTWAIDIIYFYSRNGSGLLGALSTIDEVDERCECALINCDILPGYPPNSKVNKLIGSALTSLSNNYDPNEPVNEFIYTLNAEGDVLIEIVIQSGQYSGVVSLLGTFNIFPGDFISDVYDPDDDERVITVFFPILRLPDLSPHTNLRSHFRQL